MSAPAMTDEELRARAERALAASGGLSIGARVTGVERSTDSTGVDGVRVWTERGRERGEVYLRWTAAGELELDVVRSMAMDARRHARRRAR